MVIIINITYYHFYIYHYHYRYRNQIYLTRAEAKTFKYLILNGNKSPENMGMDMMVLKV